MSHLYNNRGKITRVLVLENISFLYVTFRGKINRVLYLKNVNS